MTTLSSLFHSAREYLNPLLTTSKFKESGLLTPKEFELAGDFLCYKCPTWQWEQGEPGKRRDYLDPKKQYLQIRRVPCFYRVKAYLDMMERDEEKEVEGEDAADEAAEGWIATHVNREKEDAQPIQDMDDDEGVPVAAMRQLNVSSGPAGPAAATASSSHTVEEQSEEPEDMDEIPDDIPDMDEEEEMVEEDDPAALQQSTSPSKTVDGKNDDKILKTRTYDISITYDKYYQTPRVWLFGYSETGEPLSSAQIFEDISQDHVHKTVTIEPHPHENVSMASIHPCKHGNVMKRIIERQVEAERESAEKGGGGRVVKEMRVDQYLMLFLKFIATVIPTIEYDCKF
ncbi:autophagocytosis associated protein [Phlyctochytrium arcticum]|nr:autophagocytosis associated protein [Phlyctochytrium arcticum]